MEDQFGAIGAVFLRDREKVEPVVMLGGGQRCYVEGSASPRADSAAGPTAWSTLRELGSDLSSAWVESLLQEGNRPLGPFTLPLGHTTPSTCLCSLHSQPGEASQTLRVPLSFQICSNLLFLLPPLPLHLGVTKCVNVVLSSLCHYHCTLSEGL